MPKPENWYDWVDPEAMRYLVLALPLCLVCHGLAADRPVVGAIRWDAWHGKKGLPGQAVETSLGPQRWHFRLPFFATVVSDHEVRIDGASQAVVEREIGYARKAGLDYWAFVAYEPEDAMSLGLKFYLSSPHKHDIHFCLTVEAGRLRAMIQRIVRAMGDESYQKVLQDRPLLYLGFVRNETITTLKEALDTLKAEARKSGAGNPYIVIMDFRPERGRQLADDLGCDAISAYATNGGGSGAPYADLARYTELFWKRCKETGVPVVPIVMSGWDRRPRVEHPVPWEKYQKPGAGIEQYYQAATPRELAAHLGNALNWVAQNPDAARAKAVIIYAWNENDEGGWLVPTLSEGAARLDAIQAVLQQR